jgi:hypothetical protein
MRPGQPTPNSALDRSVRPVTPVAGAQRARQSVPPVSASVRRLGLLGMALASLLPGGFLCGCRAQALPETSNDECEVWCAVLDRQGPASQYPVSERTHGLALSSKWADRIMSSLPERFQQTGVRGPDQRMIRDFVTKNSSPCSVRLGCCGRANPQPLPTRIWGQPSEARMLSRVAFNATLDRALVLDCWVSDTSGMGRGVWREGWFILLKKIHGRWAIIASVVGDMAIS